MVPYPLLAGLKIKRLHHMPHFDGSAVLNPRHLEHERLTDSADFASRADGDFAIILRN